MECLSPLYKKSQTLLFFATFWIPHRPLKMGGDGQVFPLRNCFLYDKNTELEWVEHWRTVNLNMYEKNIFAKSF